MKGEATASDRVMAVNPLDDPLLDGFYKPHRGPGRPPKLAAARPKPTHYKIVCISLYTDDIDRLEKMVAELKKRGILIRGMGAYGMPGAVRITVGTSAMNSRVLEALREVLSR